jgi:hypothetical protein
LVTDDKKKTSEEPKRKWYEKAKPYEHPVDGNPKLICKTCGCEDSPELPDYSIPQEYGHRVSDRVFFTKKDKKGVIVSNEKGSVMWVSNDRSHVRVLLDSEKKLQSKNHCAVFTPGPITAAGKYKATRQPLTSSSSQMLAESIKREHSFIDRPAGSNPKPTSSLNATYFGGSTEPRPSSSSSSLSSSASNSSASGNRQPSESSTLSSSTRSSKNTARPESAKSSAKPGFGSGTSRNSNSQPESMKNYQQVWVKAMVPVGQVDAHRKLDVKDINISQPVKAIPLSSQQGDESARKKPTSGFGSSTARGVGDAGVGGAGSARKYSNHQTSGQNTHRNIFGGN